MASSSQAMFASQQELWPVMWPSCGNFCLYVALGGRESDKMRVFLGIIKPCTTTGHNTWHCHEAVTAFSLRDWGTLVNLKLSIFFTMLTQLSLDVFWSLPITFHLHTIPQQPTVKLTIFRHCQIPQHFPSCSTPAHVAYLLEHILLSVLTINVSTKMFTMS